MTDLVLRSCADLTLFAEEALQVHKIATALATTSFVPEAMKGKPDEITGAILFGRELGMDPMTSLQTINVIQGRPTLTANAMRGLAITAGVRFRLDEATETRCRYSALAPGETEWTTVTWSMDQAVKLGLTTKQNWKNQPGAMLIARATSQLCRLVAANVLIGSPYSTEEVRDLDGENPAPEVEKPKRRQAAVKALAPGAEPEIEANVPPPYPRNEQQKEIGYVTTDDEKRVAPEDPVERPDMIDTATRKHLMAAFNDLQIRDRTTRLEFVSKVLGREVNSVNQCSEAEGQDILTALRAYRPAGWAEPGE